MERKAILCILVGCYISNTLAACWNETRGPQNEKRWYLGLDNKEYTADDLSLNVDNVILKNLYPSNCPSVFRCDIVRYKIKWFSGKWSNYYYPGSQDIYQKSGENARHKRMRVIVKASPPEYCN